ncbi:hypothetical protein niasHT_036499 [Heterodera trifolii]|uniref:acid phosphatase n=1 Tax=Heterodera trifolii TaxID=157864 RepID=A0ABD2J6P8_9BILA
MNSYLKSLFFINCFLNLFVAATNDELILVQALWRHGDRSPTGTFRTDPNQEEVWPQGWGQLSPKGMAQHVILGRKLKARYIDQLHFVSERYLNKEIYIRSTDINRTLTSAISNMVGFYSKGMPGKDYPSERESQWWPHGFTPVAVHTIASYEDHIIPDIPDVPCPRQSKIHEIMQNTPEYRQLMDDNKQLFSDLSTFTGEKIDIFNFGLVADTLFIEDQYRDELPHPMPEWTQNRTLREQITKMDFLLEEWINGRGLSTFDGVHFDIELPRIRGGPILWILIGNMQNKLKCLSENVAESFSSLKSPIGSPLCDWIRTRKYFAYSAHDTTIAALFSALGFNKTNFDVDGYPHYSACVTFELWQNATNLEHYIKAFYWPPNSPGFEEMTRNITGCETNSTLNRFVERSEVFKPVPSPDEYCKDTHFPTNSSSKPAHYFQNIIIIYFVLFMAFSL